MATKIRTPPLRTLSCNEKAKRAAELLNGTDGREPIEILYRLLDEPRREEILAYLAEIDQRFCECLNPVPEPS